MRARTARWVVALDGGTTNTRARLLNDGRVVATARRAVGARDTALGSDDRTLARALRDVILDVLAQADGVRPDVVVACGMLTSDVGVELVPHAVAPAGVDELSRAAVWRDRPEIAPAPILFIPGVRTPAGDGPDGWTSADVMRGEECETFGAITLTGVSGSPAFLWPGSHTKLVRTDERGRIVASHTTLAGELTSAVARHTLLAASLPPALPDEPDAAMINAGARVVEEQGLGRAAFLVRVAALERALTPAQRAAFWVGAVLADDAAHIARHPIVDGCETLLIGGREPQRGIYARLLAPRVRARVEAISEEHSEIASAVGAMEVARRNLTRAG